MAAACHCSLPTARDDMCAHARVPIHLVTPTAAAGESHRAFCCGGSPGPLKGRLGSEEGVGGAVSCAPPCKLWSLETSNGEELRGERRGGPAGEPEQPEEVTPSRCVPTLEV